MPRPLRLPSPAPLLACVLVVAGWGAELVAQDTRCGRGGHLLEPEPAGAPDELARSWEDKARTKLDDDSLACLGSRWPEVDHGVNSADPTVSLPGYVRTLVDPENEPEGVPESQVEAFTRSGIKVGSAFSDTKDGRTFFQVPVERGVGFTGEVRVTMEGHLPYWLSSNTPYSLHYLNVFPWLPTAEDVQAAAGRSGAPLDVSAGIVVGAVHDCKRFGLPNAWVVVEGGGGTVHYVGTGWDIDPERTFTSYTGRFAVTGLPAGEAEISAYGRVDWGCGLMYLGTATVTVRPGEVVAFDLSPRLE